MKSAAMALRKGIDWRINGQPPLPDSWICTDYEGRGNLDVLDGQRLRFALWEAEMSLDTFIAIYGQAYGEILEEEQSQSPYEWGVVLEYDQLRHAGYPDLQALLVEHGNALRSLLLGDDRVLLELINNDEPRHYRIGYAVHGLHEVLRRDDRLILAGLAVEQDEI